MLIVYRIGSSVFFDSLGGGFTVDYTNDYGYALGYRVNLPQGDVFTQTIQRDTYRRNLITSCGHAFNGTPLKSCTYSFDALNRATRRIDGGTITNSFGYNARSEVTTASIFSNAYTFAYDFVGNHTASSVNSVSTTYSANNLNQYSQLSVPSVPSMEALSYDLDGNLLTNGVFTYSWDAENQLISISSNDVLLVSNEYDYRHRRIRKTTPQATYDSIYEGWDLIHETISATNGAVSEIEYFWGADLSGTPHGAGGVGGLLGVSIDGSFYFPCYDNNGNITAYVDESGSVVASYAYDAFGATISQSGSLADTFRFRFSTKYFDSETGLYYYGLRFYYPILHRWMNRDPIGERGGLNLYGFCENDGVNQMDVLGLKITVVVLGDSLSHGTESMGHLYNGYVEFLSIDDVGETIMLGGAGQKVGDIKKKYTDPSGKCRDKVAILAMMGMNDALSLVRDNGKSEAIRKENYSLRFNGALSAWNDLYSGVKADFERIDPKKQVLFVTVTTPSVAKTPNMRADYHGSINDINRFLGSLNQEMSKVCKAEGDWWSCATADTSQVRHTIGIDRQGRFDASISDDGVHFLDSQAKQIADIVSGVINKWAKGGK